MENFGKGEERRTEEEKFDDDLSNRLPKRTPLQPQKSPSLQSSSPSSPGLPSSISHEILLSNPSLKGKRRSPRQQEEDGEDDMFSTATTKVRTHYFNLFSLSQRKGHDRQPASPSLVHHQPPSIHPSELRHHIHERSTNRL